MLARMSMVLVLTAFISSTSPAGLVFATDKDSYPKAIIDLKEQIYGSQLMTEEEKTEYTNKLRRATTIEEREKIRKDHQERMKQRALEKGVTLPDQLPEQEMEWKRSMDAEKVREPARGVRDPGRQSLPPAKDPAENYNR